MKFLLNMNMSRELGRRLAAEGHGYRHVRDIGMARAIGGDIVTEARINHEVLLTHDLDYGHILAFSGQSTPSVIIFRLRNIDPANLSAQLIKAWPRVEGALTEGAIVILEDAAVRIRKLPIKGRD